RRPDRPRDARGRRRRGRADLGPALVAGENVRRCEVHSWLWLARSRAKRRGAARTLPPAFSRLTSFRYLEYAWSRRRTRGGSSEKGKGEGSSMKRRLLVAAALVPF